MRLSRIGTLLHKEWSRLLGNRGALVLAGLLVAAAAMVRWVEVPLLPGKATACHVNYLAEDDWVRYLKSHVPAALQGRIVFRSRDEESTHECVLVYPQGAGAIQLRPDKAGTQVWIWYPGDDASVLSEYEAWFWRETLAHLEAMRAHSRARSRDVSDATQVSEMPRIVETKYASLSAGQSQGRYGLASGLLLFAVFFFNVYLMPALQAEERERGVLLAQMLAPVSASELLVAKLLFYPACSIVLAALVASVTDREVLALPLYWLTVACASAGAWGIGMTVASLSRGPRTASITALSYLLAVTLMLAACRHFGFAVLPNVFLEYHVPQLLHAAFQHAAMGGVWFHLIMAGAVSLAWCVLAWNLFRRRGWQ